MLTYQLRPRVIRVTGTEELRFPSAVEINFYFQPLYLFGMAAGGRTFIQGQPAEILFNANNGRLVVTPRVGLPPLEVEIHEPSRLVSVSGNRVTIKQDVQDLRELAGILESFYFVLPLVLAVEFGDPPFVEHVDGRAGDTPFRWELAHWKIPVAVTTPEHEQQKFAKAWKHLDILSAPHGRRLVAALHYFHVACRVRQEEEFPGEFVAESLLNFGKILEVLYGPRRDEMRRALQHLGYTLEEIERDFVPAVLLRNHIDVGHPLLALLETRQLVILHAYTDRAEATFRTFLQRLLSKIESGEADVQPYDVAPADAELRRIVESMTSNSSA